MNEFGGFYLSRQSKNGKQLAILAVLTEISRPDIELSAARTNAPAVWKPQNKKEIMLKIYRPNTGLQSGCESLADIENAYVKVVKDKAKLPWQQQYDSSAKNCGHVYLSGSCRNVALGKKCEV